MLVGCYHDTVAVVLPATAIGDIGTLGTCPADTALEELEGTEETWALVATTEKV